MADVKICGVTDADALAAALAGGGRYVGFVFFPKSPRHLTLERAAGLAAAVQGRAETVAVTVDADPDLLAAVRKTVLPDWIQLHGRETPAHIRAARAFARKGVIRAIPIARRADLAGIAPLADAADMLLFDAKAPEGAALPGGNGAAFDWAILNGFQSPKPWLLSGGLNAGNVAEAIRTAAAPGVDVSSGVERAPGVKDVNLISAFLAAAR
jgi:phosphoribosylanthranilate isomerase